MDTIYSLMRCKWNSDIFLQSRTLVCKCEPPLTCNIASILTLLTKNKKNYWSSLKWTLKPSLLNIFFSSRSITALTPGAVSRKSRRLFEPEKPFVKLWPAYSVKLVFSYVVKGIKIKITAKFRAWKRLRFEDTKRLVSPKTCPKSFGTFEKQAPAYFNK